MRLRGFLLTAALLALPAAQAAAGIFDKPVLIQAVNADDLAKAHHAILLGDDPDVVDDNGKTPLMIAVERRNLAMVKLLVAGKASLGKVNPQGKCPLYTAAELGDAEIIDALLSGGAKVDQQDKAGVTALMVAAGHGEYDSVARLIAGGAEVDRVDYTGRDALAWAQGGHDPSVVQLLRGAAKH